MNWKKQFDTFCKPNPYLGSSGWLVAPSTVKLFIKGLLAEQKENTLDYPKMLSDIDALTNTDFTFEMECNLIPESREYTQAEAKEMANLLSKVYSISHCVHCKACQYKYEQNH